MKDGRRFPFSSPCSLVRFKARLVHRRCQEGPEQPSLGTHELVGLSGLEALKRQARRGRGAVFLQEEGLSEGALEIGELLRMP